jgi:hypothetical protein
LLEKKQIAETSRFIKPPIDAREFIDPDFVDKGYVKSNFDPY